MTNCANCGKEIVLPESTAGSKTSILKALETVVTVLDLLTDGNSFRTVDGDADQGPLQIDGETWYCNATCRGSDLTQCRRCRTHFSYNKAKAAGENSFYSICPRCAEVVERAVAAAEQGYQTLISSMQLDGDAALPSDPDHQAEDSAVYLQLAYNYLDCWERWKEGFGGRQWKARRQFEDSLRNWNAELPYEYEGAIACRKSEINHSGKYIVQCKDWKSNVGVTVVRELYGVVNAESANKGILLASSGFTKAAMEFARGKRLELIDGEQLDSLMNRYLENRTAP